MLLFWRDLFQSTSLTWVSIHARRPSDAGSPPWGLTASTWWWRPKTICGLVWSTSSATTSWAGWTSSSQETPSMFSSWLAVRLNCLVFRNGCFQFKIHAQLLVPKPLFVSVSWVVNYAFFYFALKKNGHKRNIWFCHSVQDESHFLKNMKTARCKAALPLLKVLILLSFV